MCRPKQCSKCGKTTWAGCGQHVDQVMKNVAKEDQCTCVDQGQSSGGFFAKIFK